jgi:hypothetical protein
VRFVCSSVDLARYISKKEDIDRED